MGYVIQTSRLGLRNWQESDAVPFAKMNADIEVMEYFPSILTREESDQLLDRLQQHYIDFGYTYFAVDVLETGKFIGFTGFKLQTYESPFTPAVDIGWRLKKSAWGKGYATEAAQACVDVAFSRFDLAELFSICSVVNVPSEHVMKKIGMTYVQHFEHPALVDYPAIKECVVYRKRLKSQ